MLLESSGARHAFTKNGRGELQPLRRRELALDGVVACDCDRALVRLDILAADFVGRASGETRAKLRRLGSLSYGIASRSESSALATSSSGSCG